MTRIQKETNEENLGKVTAIMIAVAQSMAPLGQMIYGLILEGFSSRAYIPIFLASFLVLILALAGRHVFKKDHAKRNSYPG